MANCKIGMLPKIETFPFHIDFIFLSIASNIELVSNSDIPVFAWKLKNEVTAETHYTLFDLADKLREKRWLVPAYTMPKSQKIEKI